MFEQLTWIYLANATLLICHEIDSAFWREWKLFHLPGGINGFLLLHILLIFMVLLGLPLLIDGRPAGYFLSLGLAGSGIFAFTIHTYFIRKGHPEFRGAVSQGILWGTLLLSGIQAIVTVPHILN